MGKHVSHLDSSARIAELVLDPGVLEATPVLELHGWAATAACGGVAVLPRRDQWLTARQQVTAVPDLAEVASAPFSQCVVHLQKGRAATWLAAAHGWHRLLPGGRLLLCGGNDLGVKSAVRGLEKEIGQAAEILSNRARARVVGWRRTKHPGPTPAAPGRVAVETGRDRFELRSAIGAFSADAVDPGSRLLLEHLPSLAQPACIFDPGCGLGVLALAGLRRWPRATAVLADIDWRAVAAASDNAAALGLAERCSVSWWDSQREPPPVERCDLALVNPPFHRGKAVDLGPARAMFRALDQVLAPGGQALIVAVRTLPFERDLGAIGRLDEVAVQGGYKLLRVTRQ